MFKCEIAAGERNMPSDRKRLDAHRIIDRYTLTGCYTTDDWNLYASACKVLGIVPLIDPCAAPIPINRV